MKTNEELLKSPTRKIDAVIDTDTYNEIDDQFAVVYMLKHSERINTAAIYAAPFSNERAATPGEGMEKSYDELMKLLTIMEAEDKKKCTYKGSTDYLKDEKTPQISDAAKDLADRAMNYTPQNPLYVVSIGAITNVASAILLNPEIKDRIVVVWLGGQARAWTDTKEFNMYQDYAAARVVMSQTNFVQLPCWLIVSEFSFTLPELETAFSGKNKISDFLLENCRDYFKEKDLKDKIIWDVTAVAWLINDNNRFMEDEITNVILPGYDGHYEEKPQQGVMCYVNKIHRNELFEDMVKTVTK